MKKESLSKLKSFGKIHVKCFLLTFVAFFCTHSVATADTEAVSQESIKITGVVSDEMGEMPGVTISVKGTNIATISDVDGRFSVSVPDRNAILVFTYIGYKAQEVPVKDRKEFNILMVEDSQLLEEVVVVGYGIQKKVNMTGAVSAVKVDDKLAARTVPNVSSGLSGLVPGLSASQNRGMAGNNAATLMIRGQGTVNNANPLIVVDGMPDADINRINMNDIESISVLKDAASSAVYGSRAANGVILITTKSGKGSERAKVNFSASYGLEAPVKSYEFMADYPRALTLHQRRSAVNTQPANQRYRNGTVDQWMALGMIDPLRYPNTDWWDIIMRDGEIQNYNVSASGGNDKSNFYASVGVMDEKGLQIENDYNRYNARFNFDYKISKTINTGVRFDGNWTNYQYALEEGFTDDNSSNTAGFDMRYAVAGITPYDPITGYYGGVMAYNEDPQAYNPYAVYKNMLNHQNRQEALGNMYIDWSPFKGFVARVDYTLKYYNQFRWKADTPNQSYNFQTNSLGSRVYVQPNAPVQNYTNTGYKTQFNARLNYDCVIAEHHDLSAMVSYNEEYWYNRNQYSSRNNRLHPSLHEIDAALTDIQGTGGSSDTEGLLSYIGRLNYVAYDKYLLELNFRVDGSSKFLPGHQYGFFPSAAIGWRFTEEDFIKRFTEGWLSHGKLRLSYGLLGNNTGVGKYEQQETLSASNYMIGGVAEKGFVYRKMVNQNLSWEKGSVSNIGLDLGFFSGRMNLELDYYDRFTSDMILGSEMSIHLTGAYDPPRKNIGDLRNRGGEINLTWNEKINDFRYSIGLNASYNKQTLEKWSEFLGKGWIFLGMPYHFAYAYESLGIAQTWEDIYNAAPQGAKPGDILRKDVNGDGRIDGNDKVAYPEYQRDRPTTNFGFNLSASWKGFDCSLLFQGAAGRKTFWLNTFNDSNFGDARNAVTWQQWGDTWSWENRGGSMPRLNTGGSNREESTFWLDDMSYLRLKNLQVGYSIPKTVLRKVGLDNVRIYATGENILTFTKYRGLDPEMQGNVNDAYPMIKSYSIGINIGI